MIKLFLKRFNKQSAGFTLVEALVAISIFTVALIGIMSVLASNIANTNYTKQKMLATYLAQEGIEYIRNLRDTYVLYSGTTGTTWADFVDRLTDNIEGYAPTAPKCQLADGCAFNNNSVNYTDDSQAILELLFSKCPDDNCADGVIRYDEFQPQKGYGSSGVATGFVRIINVNIISTDEIKIYSTVTWTQVSGSQSITFSENLFNWVQ